MDRMLYSHDLAPLPKEAGMAFKNVPDVVVRPKNGAEISKIVSLAYRSGVAVVPRGNATWGLGGCMPTCGGILLDMTSKMNEILEIDTEGMFVKVQAGCTWKKLLDECMKKGYIIGSYPSSFPSGTIGAWISTNGMGIGSYKYGSAKDNVLNMEVITSDGTILETGYDHIGSYMSGYNLNQLFAGAEGTLGIISTVTFRIYPMGVIKPTAYEFEDLRDLAGPIEKIVQHPSVKPLHIAYSDYLHFANQKKAGIDAPDVKNMLLVTFQGEEEFVALEEKAVDAIVAEFGGRKISDEIAAHEWEERCYEFRARRVGVGEIPAEVITPVKHFAPFIDECYKGFEVMKMEAGGVIGVVVDRSTVLYMPYYFKDDESLLGMTAFAFNFYLGDRAMKYGGRTTGLGVFFAWNLDNIHDACTVNFMRELKTYLDPNDVINPGHVVCGKTRFGIDLSNQIMGLGSSLIQNVKKLLPENTTFADNKARFRYDDLEHRKAEDRFHELGKGTE
ncbi:MAG: FAD-binding oxidoreductase [Candidatus Methanomethylophilaceae archaeon]|nr:FAD-binding oxidoreductase [Candidatus Methanomethylophilaceae archaeon]NLF33709.1 FAD-binding oxidoreductase [Thermoplasmatales archaeon]